MSETVDFGLIVLIVAGGFTVAIALSKVTERFPVPGPALFLLAAAIGSDVFPGLTLPIKTVERVGVVALVIILFDGGMHVGLRRFRSAAAEIVSLGIVGTFATAGVMAVAAHVFFGFGWTAAGILGAALSPTDPAVMFSVLGNREVRGSSGTILEGESGANDPVGIALMIGMLDFATHHDASFTVVFKEFAIEMSIGLAVGVAGGWLLLRFVRGVALPSESLYPIRTLASAGVVYGLASVAHGSGFLAVFVAGLLVGDARMPHKRPVTHFHTSLASLGEIVVFTTLGLTIELGKLGHVWVDGLLLALILAFVARPLVVGPLLLPSRLRRGERLFVMWGGLKGAVPILLGTLVLLENVHDARRIYDIVFVVVAFSVVVQGTSIPFVAPRLGVPMRAAAPGGIRSYVVEPQSRAAGRAIGDLPIGANSWVERVDRGGKDLRVDRGLMLEDGDEVWLTTDNDDAVRLTPIFKRSD
jgi:potassium/hydrogen antiporter